MSNSITSPLSKNKRYFCNDCYCGFDTMQNYNYHLKTKKHNIPVEKHACPRKKHNFPTKKPSFF